MAADDIIRGEVSLEGLTEVTAELAALRTVLGQLKNESLMLDVEFKDTGVDTILTELNAVKAMMAEAQVKEGELVAKLNELNAAIGTTAAKQKAAHTEKMAQDQAERASAEETAAVVEKAEVKKRSARSKTRQQAEVDAEAIKLADRQAALAAEQAATVATRPSPRPSPQQLEALHTGTPVPRPQPTLASTAVPAPTIIVPEDPASLRQQVRRVEEAAPPAMVTVTTVPHAPVPRPTQVGRSIYEERTTVPIGYGSPDPTVEEWSRANTVQQLAEFRRREAQREADFAKANEERQITEVQKRLKAQEVARAQAMPGQEPPILSESDIRAQVNRQQIRQQDINAREQYFRRNMEPFQNPREALNTPYYDRTVGYNFGPAQNTTTGRNEARESIEAAYRQAMNAPLDIGGRDSQSITEFNLQRNKAAMAARDKARKELLASIQADYDRAIQGPVPESLSGDDIKKFKDTRKQILDKARTDTLATGRQKIEDDYFAAMNVEHPSLRINTTADINKAVFTRGQTAAAERTAALKPVDEASRNIYDRTMLAIAQDRIRSEMEWSEYYKGQYGVSNLFGTRFREEADLQNPVTGENPRRPGGTRRGVQSNAPDMHKPGKAKSQETLDKQEQRRLEREQQDRLDALKEQDRQQAIAVEAQTAYEEKAHNFEMNRGPAAVSKLDHDAINAEAGARTDLVADAASKKNTLAEAEAIRTQKRDLWDAQRLAKEKADQAVKDARLNASQAVSALATDKDDPDLQFNRDEAMQQLEMAKAEAYRQSNLVQLKQKEFTEARRSAITAKTEYSEANRQLGGPSGGLRPQAGVVNAAIKATDTDDAIQQLERLGQNVDKIKAAGGRVNVTVTTTGGLMTEEELIKVGAAARAVADKGTVKINVEAVGADKTLAQMEAINASATANARNRVNVNYDTTGTQEARALRQQDLDYRRAVQSSNQTGRFGARMDAQRAAEEKADADEALRLIKEKEAAQKAADDIEEAAQRRRLQPFQQTANTQSRSFLGVPAGLAAPAGLGLGVGASVFEAAGYQTLVTTTGNQTNLDARGIGQLDQSVRGAQSGSPDLGDLALGFKNITDLGYSATDSQKIFTEESKAATAAGSDQASVMLAITSSMKDYNATADDVAKFTNTTVEAARLANSSFETWSQTTRRATAIAAAYGVPLQEVDALLVALTRHGFNTAQANTQVAGLIQNIVAPIPSAKKRLGELSAETGIDLVGDFSQEGLQAKGTKGVLDDLANATRGDEALIKSLIPALRGGQAALILTTAASGDFREELGFLGQTVDGSLKPVEDGFTRIQATTGYKFGQFLKDLKFEAIDVGNGFLPMANTIIGALSAVPASTQRVVIELAAMGLALKTVSIGYDVTTAAVGRWIAANNAAAASAQRTAIATALGPGATKVAINAEVEAAGVAVATGIIPKISTAVAATLALAGPFTAGIAVAVGITHFIIDPLFNKHLDEAVNNELNNSDPTKVGLTASGLPKTSSPFIDKINDYKNVTNTLDPKNPVDRQTLMAMGKQLEEMDKEAQKVIDDYKPSLKARLATKVGGTDVQDEYNKGVKLKVDEAIGAIKDRLDTTKKKSPFEEEDAESEEQKRAAQQQAIRDELDAAQHYAELRTKRDELLAKGAPAKLVNLALFPEDFSMDDGRDTERIKKAKADLAEWERQYGEVQKAASGAKTVLESIDISKGMSGLAGQADKLKEIDGQLQKFHSGTAEISGLTNIAMQFKGIEDAEKAASAAFNGFMLTLDETDRRSSTLETFKRRVEAQVARSQDAVARGTATDEDRQFLKDAPDILGNLNKQISDVNQNGIPDLIGASKNLPNLKKVDEYGRSIVSSFGGGQKLILDVQAKIDKAKSDIQAVVDGPWTAYINLQTVDKTNATNSPPPGPSTTANEVIGINTGAPLATPGSAGPQGQFRTYSPISPAEWAKIVPANSPMADLTTLSQLNAAARTAGIDPRYLASFFANEGNFSTVGGQGQWQVDAKNPGGLLFADQPGAVPGPLNEIGKPYASFDSYGSYFQAMVKQISQYTAFGQNDAAGVAGAWTKGPGAAGTPDFNDAAEAKLKYYRQYLAQQIAMGSVGLPPSTDIGGPGDPDYAGGHRGEPGTGPGRDYRMPWLNPLPAGAQTGFGNRPFQPNSTHVGLGAEDLDAAYGTPVRASAAGRVIQSGYDAGYGNNTTVDYGQGINVRYGHFANPAEVKAGDVLKAGQELGLVGSTGNSTGPHLHFEVTVNGVQTDPKKIGFNFDDPSHMGSAPSSGTVITGKPGVPTIPTVDATGKVDDRYKMNPFLDVNAQARQLARIQQGLDLPGQQRLGAASQSFGQYAKDYYENLPANFGNKGQADDQANRATLNYTIALGTALEHVHQMGAATDADYAKILATAGALGPVTVQWVKAQEQVSQAMKVNKEAQAEIKQINDQQFSQQQSRAWVDRDIAATQLTQQRNQENADIKRNNDKRDADRRIEDERDRYDVGSRAAQRSIQTDTYREDDRYVGIQRTQQDKERALQFQQQVQATNSQNELQDLQKRQALTTFQNTAQEQLLSRMQRAAPTNAIASGYTTQLAFAHERDLAQRDADRKAIDDIQLRVREEQKKANLDTYNLQTETLNATRAHENTMHQIDLRSRAQAIVDQDESVRRSKQDRDRQRSYEDETVRIEALRLEQKRSDEDTAIALATRRAVEDEANATRLHDLQDIIDHNNTVITDWQNYQNQLDGVISQWRDLATYAGNTADDAAKIFASVPTSTVQNIPKRARGGPIANFAIVGDGPGGQILPTTEVVHAPGMDVTPIRDIIVASAAPTSSGSRSTSSQTIIQMPISATVANMDDVEAALRREFEISLQKMKNELIKRSSMARQRVGA